MSIAPSHIENVTPARSTDQRQRGKVVAQLYSGMVGCV